MRDRGLLLAKLECPRAAVEDLERYLELKSDDATAYYYAVQWFYTVHSQGVVVHNRAQDVQLAKDYATAYEKSGGPQLPLVKQWISFLESEK